ncbi:MAG: D-alanyl-D-alanine carboxypeptidase [Treponema sp.]|jgi:D-alanyl-D-alanine carboxypeptidase (penicillin-binding protein 5/6)|nr:D-alanyl-D-alanine carboxypeptidase [Treponema sp.]
MTSFNGFFYILMFLAVLGVSGQEYLPGTAKPPLRDSAAAAPDLGSQAAALLDASTGVLLYAKNAEEEIPPASLTKLMTMHIALNEVYAGKASLDEIVPLPREAWASSQPPRSSRMSLAQGQRVSLQDLFLGMAIPSGNDAAVAVALRFAPTVEEFAALMNQEARRFGLSKTRFVEPSGLSEDNMTTAIEFARFCAAYLSLHPETLKAYHSVRSFAFPRPENVPEAFQSNPGTVIRRNNNLLLDELEGVDGLKTGYIDESGYNIALTAEREGTRFVAVILGAPAVWGGERIRDDDGKKLLTWAFEYFKTLRPAIGPVEPVRIWKGKNNQAELIPAYTPVLTVQKERGISVSMERRIIGPVIAPLPKGTALGTMILYDNYGELTRIPLITASEQEQGGFFKRIADSLRLFFSRLFGNG